MMSPLLDMKEKWFAPHRLYHGQVRHEHGSWGWLANCARGYRCQRAVCATTIATGNRKSPWRRQGHEDDRKPKSLRTPPGGFPQGPARDLTGNFLIDDRFASEGVTDFGYRITPITLAPDFFVPDDRPPPKGVTLGPS